jgi:hypothetical protein
VALSKKGDYQDQMGAEFDVSFAIFVALILGLAVVSVRWGISRDRAQRAARREGPGDSARTAAQRGGGTPADVLEGRGPRAS